MLRILVLATIAQVSAGLACPAAERVRLGTVATSLAYEGQLVEVCGTFNGRDNRSAADPRERLLLVGSDRWGYYAGVTVFDPELALGPDGRERCVVGVHRRRDGLSRQEARARGIGTSVTDDAPVRYRDYVFYPAQCTYDEPALG
jgi:hypothetical protein